MRDKLHVILHDNAANVVKASRDVLKISYVTCMAHMLKLVVGDAMKTQRMVIDAMGVARRLVGQFKHSSSATAELQEIQTQLNMRPVKQVVQDVSTQWNSTFYMTERLLELRRPITVNASDHQSRQH